MNPKDKIGVTKVQLNLVPSSAIIYAALGLQDGAVKYGPFNWRDEKIQVSVYIAALLRHILQFQDGELLAADSGKPHLAHAIAGLSILIDAIETGNAIDDRPQHGSATVLLARYQKTPCPEYPAEEESVSTKAANARAR